jgi:hypothetical protein
LFNDEHLGRITEERMPKAKTIPAKTPHKRTLRARVSAFIRRVSGDRWNWFDHPEMQARIEKAESDRREGRVERFDSREAAFRHLDSIA